MFVVVYFSSICQDCMILRGERIAHRHLVKMKSGAVFMRTTLNNMALTSEDFKKSEGQVVKKRQI